MGRTSPTPLRPPPMPPPSSLNRFPANLRHELSARRRGQPGPRCLPVLPARYGPLLRHARPITRSSSCETSSTSSRRAPTGSAPSLSITRSIRFPTRSRLKWATPTSPARAKRRSCSPPAPAPTPSSSPSTKRLTPACSAASSPWSPPTPPPINCGPQRRYHHRHTSTPQTIATSSPTPPLTPCRPSSARSRPPPGYGDAIVSWTTSKPADSLVQYGESVLLGRTAYAATLVTNHIVTISALSANRDYYYQVTSRDAAGNTATDDNQGALYTFTTRKGPSASVVRRLWKAAPADGRWCLILRAPI